MDLDFSCFNIFLSEILSRFNIDISGVIIVTCGYYYNLLGNIRCKFILTNKDPYDWIISKHHFRILSNSVFDNSTLLEKYVYLFIYLDNFDSIFYGRVTSLCETISDNIYFVFLCTSFNRHKFCRIVSRCSLFVSNKHLGGPKKKEHLVLLISSLFRGFDKYVFIKMLNITSPFIIGRYIYKVLLINSLEKTNVFSIESKLIYFIQCNNIKFYSVSDIKLFFSFVYLLKNGKSISI
ncbi:hypothetical protein JSR06_00335 [Candidatus Vidania fulgoroideae]|uniref:Uncharacterized protein n=1 Tax=Candidatus Vidania fulgoroideorum TaxID=881286 RepID=A0A974XDY2_9PROT|nr:hypothetical protein JSR06_00335 [Candidatus Vidania fulgoroideae]